MTALFILGFFSFVAFLAFSITFSVNYYIYCSSTKRRGDGWDYATFEDFKTESNKSSWEFLSDRLFLDFPNNSSISEFWIEIRGKGMVLGVKDYFLYSRFIKKMSNAYIGKRQNGTWSKKGKGNLKVVK